VDVKEVKIMGFRVRYSGAKLIPFECPKCGTSYRIHESWRVMTCEKCGTITTREGGGQYAKISQPHWKREALEALNRERERDHYIMPPPRIPPPNHYQLKSLVEAIEVGLKDVEDAAKDFKETKTLRYLLNAVYLFAGIETKFIGIQDYIKQHWPTKYAQISSHIIVLRNQLNDLMDTVR
jgi:ribosomal protein L37AE/L43A